MRQNDPERMFSLMINCPSRQRGDVIFVIDGSDSIDENSFNHGKNFVTDFISGLDVGPNPSQSRVGVITYGNDVTVDMDFRKSGRIGLESTQASIGGETC